jgi:hypothetical protein
MKKTSNPNPHKHGFGDLVLVPLVLAGFFYFGVGSLLPGVMRRMAIHGSATAVQGAGIVFSVICGLYTLKGVFQWVWGTIRERLMALFKGFRVDPREDLRVLPPLKGELTDSKKAELHALTKIAKGWSELEDELKVRGFRMAPHSHDLCLATLNSSIEVLCTMSSLGLGSSYESLCRRFGTPPEHLVPLRRAV